MNIIKFLKNTTSSPSHLPRMLVLLFSTNMPYTNLEYADMVFCYGFCNGNGSESAREYARRYPDRLHPDRKTIENVFRRLRETGSFKVKRDGRPVARPSDDIISEFNVDPSLSTRRVAVQIGVSHMAVQRELTEDLRYPYHLTPVQHLLDADNNNRREFCEWFIRKSREEPGFPRKVLYTDEATFTRSGIFNFRNAHNWMHENPHATRQSAHQHQFKVNVWLGMLGKHLLRPIFIADRFNSATFLELLEDSLPIIMEDIPLVERADSWFQMDGCPAHSSREVTTWINDHYREKWIGRYGPVKWPARSPDLTPMDFYVWGTLKTAVYSEPIRTKEQLVQRIIVKYDEMRRNQQQILAAADSVLKRARICQVQRGGYIENFL